MHVLMLFLDGVGIGKRDSAKNPFVAAQLPTLRWLLGGPLTSLRRRRFSNRHASLVPLDATLGVDGLPQSGTGQTALFTGVNAAKIVGRHFGPYPYSTLRPVIKGQNIFRQVLEAGLDPYFANAFPQRFFEYFDGHPTRVTVTTMSYVMAGLPLLKANDLQAGRGVSADITNIGWAELGYPHLGLIEPAEAGRRLAHLAAEYDFVLYEYWKTDEAGHSLNMQLAVDVLEVCDAMLAGVIEHLDLRKALMILVSDHGNIEDMSIKVHTRHPVPALVYGRGHEKTAERLRSSAHPSWGTLMSVTPTVLEILAHRSAS